MSKYKVSFSLILALLLVGILSSSILSSSVFAASDPYKLTPTQVVGTDNVSVTFVSSQPSQTYDMYIYDPSTKSYLDKQTYKGITASTTATFTGLIPGISYVVKLTVAGNNPDTQAVSSVLAGVVDVHNTPLLNATNPSKTSTSGDTVTFDKNGSGLSNANKTGQAPTSKKRSGQKMHGFYQNNTNSCASCHQTHTAANGESLLFKDGTYSTCSACHDGTTGANNSFSPVSASTVNSIDGTFNVQQVDSNGVNHNGSMHVADGSLQVSAAPGGNHTSDGSALNTATWGSEFDCASCHSAHGGGSAGENNLSTNPNGWGGVQYVASGTKDQQNGKLFLNQPIQNGVPSSFVTPYILVKTTAGAVVAPTATKTSTGYLYYRAGLTDGTTPVIQTYRWDGNKYVADFSLWLRDVGHVGAPFKNANTVLKDNTGADITTTNMKVQWQDGFAFGTGVSSVASYDLSVGIDVETTSDLASLYDSTDPNYIVDSGTEMSKYCAACHTDYLSTTRTNNTGVYSVAHRHATAQDRLTCVRCHYAHGSDAQIMKDANDNSFYNLTTGKSPDGSTVNTLDSTTALQYLADPNPSSALKRYTGMSVCYSCHGKGEAFLGNPNITGDTTTGQTLKNGDPGVAGTSGVIGGGRSTLTTRH
jgi:hypothetical protein